MRTGALTVTDSTARTAVAADAWVMVSSGLEARRSVKSSSTLKLRVWTTPTVLSGGTEADAMAIVAKVRLKFPATDPDELASELRALAALAVVTLSVPTLLSPGTHSLRSVTDTLTPRATCAAFASSIAQREALGSIESTHLEASAYAPSPSVTMTWIRSAVLGGRYDCHEHAGEGLR